MREVHGEGRGGGSVVGGLRFEVVVVTVECVG